MTSHYQQRRAHRGPACSDQILHRGHSGHRLTHDRRREERREDGVPAQRAARWQNGGLVRGGVGIATAIRVTAASIDHLTDTTGAGSTSSISASIPAAYAHGNG
jgi:hypothetical protein